MTKLFIDTNVCLYFFTPDSSFNTLSTNIFSNLVYSQQEGIITPYVLNEFHYHLLRKKDPIIAKEKVQQLLSLPNIVFVNPFISYDEIFEIADICIEHRMKTFDAYHAYTCKKLGIKHIATFDSDFERIPWLKVWKE